MNKEKTFETFLEKLRENLYFFSSEEREQIIEDYKDLYSEKLEAKKTEKEILEELDSPQEIAENYAKELNIKTSKYKREIYKYKNKINKKYIEIEKKLKESFKKEKEAIQANEQKLKENLENKKGYYFKRGYEIIKALVRLMIKTLKVLIKKILKLIRVSINIAIYLTLISATLIYIFSFFFIKVIGPYALTLRILETLMYISFFGILYMSMSFIKGSNE